MPFNDLREFIDAARELGQVKEIHGAHWNLEIGALTEMFAFKEPSPLVLFDQIPGYPAHFRVASNLISNPVRSGLTVGMPADASASIEEALTAIGTLGFDPPPRILMTGSLYLAGEVLVANGTELV